MREGGKERSVNNISTCPEQNFLLVQQLQLEISIYQTPEVHRFFPGQPIPAKKVNLSDDATYLIYL